jgi:uncharacterized protein (TIGR00730 family)
MLRCSRLLNRKYEWYRPADSHENMQSICVFCGSNVGINGLYRTAAESLGAALVQRGLRLVYGGGSVGLMGVVADAVLEAGGEVTGVLPEVLATKELLHPGVHDMHIVPGMHARKARMVELADGFIALPGGYGTFEELFEIVTWAQLGLHQKPIGLLNAAGYFNGLIDLIDHAVDQGFIKAKHRELLVVGEESDSLIDALAKHKVPSVGKWITPSET